MDPFNLLAAIVSGGGKLWEGLAGSSMAAMSSRVASDNVAILSKQAEIARGKADLALTGSSFEEARTRFNVGQVLGGQSAHWGAGNVDATYGSPLLMQGFSAAQGEVDAQIIRAKGQIEAADAISQGANIQASAANQAWKAASDMTSSGNALIAGVLGAGTSFLQSRTKWGNLTGSTTPTNSPSPATTFDPNRPFGIY